jgi:hypothetical protein
MLLNSRVLFCEKRLNAKDIYKEMFPGYGVTWFTTGTRNYLKDIRKSQMMSDQVRFDALVKRWNKCIIVGLGYVEKYMFFSGFEYHLY